MKVSHMLFAVAMGVAGGIALVEFCPKVKQMLDKGKQMIKKKTD